MPIHFLHSLLLVLGILLLAPPAQAAENTLSPEELADGWILLFDGETLFGWNATSEADWRVDDGAIRVGSGEKGLLCTTTQFGDYVFKADFRAAKGTNSGVFLRTAPQPADPAVDCYELNIAAPDVSEFPTGSLVGRKKADGATGTADWQTFELRCEGGRFVVKLDGEQVLDYTDPQPLGRGLIGLQLNQGDIAFRNLKLKPLGMEPIFNGENLAGWNDDLARESEFSVTDEGALQVKDGPGQLESEGSYGDFVLQLDVFVNGEELNSGVFFRSIPGEFQNGYEAQIHNGVKPGTDQPSNGGTGGIFRRQEARRVVSKDFEWTAMTIVADDAHMACWVNGFQVTDWTDPREPHANPRQGKRLEAGTLILQGHDPTTDLRFRDLRISEIPPRRSAP